MELDWNDIRYFLAIAENQSIPAASKYLKVNHSTVLRRLDHMEARLNLTLFIREKGSCTLTEAGNTVLISAKRMEENALQLQQLLFKSDDHVLSGSIVVSASDFVTTQLILPKFSDFFKNYPDLEISFVTTNQFLDLGQRDADIVVRLTDNPKEHLPANLFGRRIGYVDLCAYQGIQNRKSNLKWMAWDHSVNFDDWIKANKYPHFPKAGIVNSCLVQLHAIKSDTYGAILPCFLGDHDKEVKRIKGCKPFQGFEAWLLTHPDLKGIKRIEVTMKYLAEALEKEIRL